jgi:hypothetical protein
MLLVVAENKLASVQAGQFGSCATIWSLRGRVPDSRALFMVRSETGETTKPTPTKPIAKPWAGPVWFGWKPSNLFLTTKAWTLSSSGPRLHRAAPLGDRCICCWSCSSFARCLIHLHIEQLTYICCFTWPSPPHRLFPRTSLWSLPSPRPDGRPRQDRQRWRALRQEHTSCL